mmetsp:Transcript_8088/g.20643  ORF Transcript_8088/g.20643 Transcript_8088/m.20643 type:complete len:281 (-) Transcript_8088:830-1672(-)
MNSVCPPQPVAIVGKPDDIASANGRHQPSPCVGSTKASAARYNEGMSSVGRLSMIIVMRSFTCSQLIPRLRNKSVTSSNTSVPQDNCCVFMSRRALTSTLLPLASATTVEACGNVCQNVFSNICQFFRDSHLKTERNVKVPGSFAVSMKSSNFGRPNEGIGAGARSSSAILQLKRSVSTASGSTCSKSLFTEASEKERKLKDEGTQIASNWPLHRATASALRRSVSIMLLLTLNKPPLRSRDLSSSEPLSSSRPEGKAHTPSKAACTTSTYLPPGCGHWA